ncbi:methyltransferase family protein [Arenibacter latericius]|uniref:methyltransferase family protein n=1 Tax=Arenibacter latericius TaxID=86104 RepID=UPI000428D950|nr:isoprenylcysteine carboxylmethyltransferase family protein [Arenibacter latericius]
MKLKIPPLLVVVLFAGLMFILAEYLPVGYFDFFGRKYLMLFLFSMSGLIGIVSLVQFFKAKTTINPSAPSKTTMLVTGGLYEYSRNPMYLALLLLLLGWGLYLGNAFNTLLAAGFVYYMNAFQIIPEEEALFKKFPKEFQKYCVKVRRWF